ncbi:hypothetical protein QUB60_07880 [Microcoleus sp. A2-C5]
MQPEFSHRVKFRVVKLCRSAIVLAREYYTPRSSGTIALPEKIFFA